MFLNIAFLFIQFEERACFSVDFTDLSGIMYV
jgi:hypothetical protein